jgi:hypothetical protein
MAKSGNNPVSIIFFHSLRILFAFFGAPRGVRIYNNSLLTDKKNKKGYRLSVSP